MASETLVDTVDVVKYLARSLPTPVFLAWPDGRIDWANAAATVVFGMPEGKPANWHSVFETDGTGYLRGGVQDAVPRNGDLAGEAQTLAAAFLPRSDMLLVVQTGTVEDTSLAEMQRQLADEQLARSDLDRTLKAETYFNRKLLHRVKNNLALLAAITRYRAAAIDAPDVRSALRAIHQRIGAIALVHELLDEARTVDVLDAGRMLSQLAVHLQGTSSPAGVTIDPRTRPFTLSVADATPLCLLVNELVVRLMSTVGGTDMRGAIQIKMVVAERHRFVAQVRVAHGAAGGPSDIALADPVPEIDALTRQLRATVTPLDDGTGWTIAFRPNPPGNEV